MLIVDHSTYSEICAIEFVFVKFDGRTFDVMLSGCDNVPAGLN
jgi:hypothetical protein